MAQCLGLDLNSRKKIFAARGGSAMGRQMKEEQQKDEGVESGYRNSLFWCVFENFRNNK